MEKLCVFCTRLEMDTTGCYGDYPDPATFRCRKGHWAIDEYGFPDDFRRMILKAETCSDYDQVKVKPTPSTPQE